MINIEEIKILLSNFLEENIAYSFEVDFDTAVDGYIKSKFKKQLQDENVREKLIENLTNYFHGEGRQEFEMKISKLLLNFSTIKEMFNYLTYSLQGLTSQSTIPSVTSTNASILVNHNYTILEEKKLLNLMKSVLSSLNLNIFDFYNIAIELNLELDESVVAVIDNIQTLKEAIDSMLPS